MSVALTHIQLVVFMCQRMERLLLILGFVLLKWTKCLSLSTHYTHFLQFQQQNGGGGQMEGKWQHDMYQGGFNGVSQAQTPARGGSGSKLLISNLDYGVSDDDIMVRVSEREGVLTCNEYCNHIYVL